MAAKQENAPANSPAPTADALRDEILKKNEKPANTGSFGAIKPLDRPSQQPVEAKPKPKPAEAPEQPKKSSTPDISDILQKSENSARKKKPEDISVDDLVKLIEEEKKKLS